MRDECAPFAVVKCPHLEDVFTVRNLDEGIRCGSSGQFAAERDVTAIRRALMHLGGEDVSSACEKLGRDIDGCDRCFVVHGGACYVCEACGFCEIFRSEHFMAVQVDRDTVIELDSRGKGGF